MTATSVSLLEKLRSPGDAEAWGQLVELYTPLLLAWARRAGLQEADAVDLVQNVFVILLRKLPEFTYDPAKSFRSWLRTVAMNEWRARAPRRVPAPLAGAPEAQAPEQEAFWEREYRGQLVQRAPALMQREFEPTTWKACWETVVNGRSTPEVAAELGMQPGAVRVAKFRVLNRLRERLDGMLD